MQHVSEHTHIPHDCTSPVCARARQLGARCHSRSCRPARSRPGVQSAPEGCRLSAFPHTLPVGNYKVHIPHQGFFHQQQTLETALPRVGQGAACVATSLPPTLRTPGNSSGPSIQKLPKQLGGECLLGLARTEQTPSTAGGLVVQCRPRRGAQQHGLRTEGPHPPPPTHSDPSPGGELFSLKNLFRFLEPWGGRQC